MDRFEEQETATSEASSGAPAEVPRLSAAYLPYDDERLWVGMPAEEQRKSRARKRRTPKPPKPRKGRPRAGEDDGTATGRFSRLARPISITRKQLAAAIVTLALPLSAFAITGLVSQDVDLPAAPVEGASTAAPIPVTLEVTGLRAERVTPKRVDLAWETPALDGPLTYAVYRDGVVIAETTEAIYTDTEVDPQRYYYYAIAAVASDGRAAASPQLLVAVPSGTGELPEGPAPEAPAPIVTVAYSPSPSPTKSASPSPSKSASPSPSPCPATKKGCPGYYVDPCSIDNTQYGCPGWVDPCSIDNTQQGCPGYIDCSIDNTQQGCPGYVDCSVDNTQQGCPGYIDCSVDNSQQGCPGYVDCVANPTDPLCAPAPASAVPPPPTLVPILPLAFRWRRRRRRAAPTKRSRWRWPDA